MSNNRESRRRFIQFLGAALAAGFSATKAEESAAVSGDNHPSAAKPSVGIALGGGGANGLAHILMLEALDEIGIKIQRIAGTSIGSIIGAFYASGMSGRQIRHLVEDFIIDPEEHVLEQLVSKDALRWVDFIEVELGNGGLLSADGFLSFMYEELRTTTFEALNIPLKVTAADLWKREAVVLETGDLLSAIRASMALPGVFEPVVRDGRVLVDGGTFNPVPYDLLLDECDVVIAIDVIGRRTRPESEAPGYFETLFNSAKVMQAAVMAEKRKYREPAVYLAPDIVDIRALEFYRAREVFAQAEPAKRELKRRLAELAGS